MASASPEQATAGMEAWMAWAQKSGDAVVDLGTPIQATAGVSADGACGNDSQASGYSLLQGSSRDEIDAPLDEENTLRFTRVIRELAARTQFIVITHSKPTMEMADALYGVTMEDAGVSSLVSVRMNRLLTPA